MERHITSVFSDYQPIQTNSNNSKQLQYWLKQLSHPINSANFGFEWTFMSQQSSQNQSNTYHNKYNQSAQFINKNEFDEISFGKTINSSIQKQKQNNSLVSNQSGVQSKSKSYVNAMLALQKKVKTLEDQNVFMRKNLSKLNQQKNKSINESWSAEEQFKNRLKVLEPKMAKVDELIQENKKLKESKEDRNRKIKALEKKIQQLKSEHEKIHHDYEITKKQKQQITIECDKNTKIIQQLKLELNSLYQKNKLLEELKQKSTVSLLQKYNKSIQFIKQIQKQNVKLKNEIQFMLQKNNQHIKSIQVSHNAQIQKCQIQFQKLKQGINLKQSLIQQKQRQAEYFKNAYEKKDEQIMKLIRSRNKVKNKEDQKHRILGQKQQQQKEQLKFKQAQGQKLIKNSPTQLNSANRVIPTSQQSSMIKMPQTLLPGNKASFAGLDSQQQEEQYQFDQSVIQEVSIPKQTKSVGKAIRKKQKQRKAALSSQSRSKKGQEKERNSKKLNTSNLINKMQKDANLLSPRKHIKIQKKRIQQEGSIKMKSCEAPKTRKIQRITFEGDCGSETREGINNYYYPIQNPSMVLRQEQLNVKDFHCKINASWQSIDEVLLIELQRQLLELYEEQENLILASNEEFVTQGERSEFVGRLKQLNEQLRTKNQKICELKSKI